jgi:hypothetical protein
MFSRDEGRISCYFMRCALTFRLKNSQLCIYLHSTSCSFTSRCLRRRGILSHSCCAQTPGFFQICAFLQPSAPPCLHLCSLRYISIYTKERRIFLPCKNSPAIFQQPLLAPRDLIITCKPCEAPSSECLSLSCTSCIYCRMPLNT